MATHPSILKKEKKKKKIPGHVKRKKIWPIINRKRWTKNDPDIIQVLVDNIIAILE